MFTKQLINTSVFIIIAVICSHWFVDCSLSSSASQPDTPQASNGVKKNDFSQVDIFLIQGMLDHFLLFDAEEMQNTLVNGCQVQNEMIEEAKIKEESEKMVAIAKSVYDLANLKISVKDYSGLYKVLYNKRYVLFSSPKSTVDSESVLLGAIYSLGKAVYGSADNRFVDEMTELFVYLYNHIRMVEVLCEGSDAHFHPKHVIGAVYLMNLYEKTGDIENAQKIGLETLEMMSEVHYEGEDAKSFINYLNHVMNLK